MTPELYSMLAGWLESGTEAQKAHARYRLSLPDAAGYEMPPGWTPPPSAPEQPALVPVRESIRGTRLGFRSCLYSSHEGCGCTGTHCYHLRRVVTLRDCLDCLPPIKEPA